MKKTLFFFILIFSLLASFSAAAQPQPKKAGSSQNRPPKKAPKAAERPKQAQTKRKSPQKAAPKKRSNPPVKKAREKQAEETEPKVLPSSSWREEPAPSREIAAPVKRYRFTQEEIDLRRQIVQKARRALETQNIAAQSRRFRRDCSGFVESVMYQVKKPIAPLVYGNFGGAAGNIFVNSKEHFFDKKSERRPLPGDFLYFNNTYDRNKNNRLDDPITHIGIVEKIDEDGTISMIHLLKGRVVRGYLNLEHPRVHKMNGKIINSYIRRPQPRDPKGTPYLMGEAYHGYTKSLLLLLNEPVFKEAGVR